MTAPVQGIWGEGVWGTDLWGTPIYVPPPPVVGAPPGGGVTQPPDTGYSDVGLVSTIEMGASMTITQLIEYAPPPPQVIPYRRYRAQMGDYRVRGGIPVSPPTIDVSVPVGVSVALSQAPVPDATRPLPADIDTGATLRWRAEHQSVTVSADGSSTTWRDIDGGTPWMAYDAYQPMLAGGYSYLIPTPNSAEILTRPALVFDPAAGDCMNAVLGSTPVNSADGVEFLFVLWSHPLAIGARASAILDSGGPVRGPLSPPFAVSDLVVGMRQGLSRFTGEGLVLWQDEVGFPMWWAQVVTRPMLVRARFGLRPLLECWGPKGVHMVHRPARDQPRQALSTSYVLGRETGQVSGTTNAGMHLMEVSYYDHELSEDELTSAVRALDACYAISA